jgi:hypothetical protein
MNVRNLVTGSILSVGMLACGFAIGQSVNPNRHPNLAAAQVFIDQAINKISVAQQANEFDLNGHAQNAKGYLIQANREIKIAAAAANRNGR